MDATNKSHETFKITDNWYLQAKQLKEKYSQLDDSDLKYQNGKEYELLKRTGLKLNKKRDGVVSILLKEFAENS